MYFWEGDGWTMGSREDLEKRVSRLVAQFIEHIWPHLERQGGTPDEPMQAAKGSTNPPIGDYAHGLIDANRIASTYLHWALEEVAKGDVKSSDGIPFSEVLLQLRYEPARLQTWRDRAPAMRRAFTECCRWAAKGVIFVHGQTKAEREELTRRLDLSADDPEALVVRRHPQDEEESRGRTRAGQRIDTMHTRRLMVEQLEQVERSTGYTGLEAMEILSERKSKEGKDWSVAKIRKAREVINRERRGDGDAA